ncbi:hypothetical protein LR48_Vigan09g091100 [Vigna angularis]|uniref:Uncharacterized protein n=1 Tax=Phaseolus angularis TaxID=3914 RepID=A0A0L9VBE7_PHAAN|nr:hypothetical protein LR48_Vigan09g091100 [Vigna angularis]
MNSRSRRSTLLLSYWNLSATPTPTPVSSVQSSPFIVLLDCGAREEWMSVSSFLVQVREHFTCVAASRPLLTLLKDVTNNFTFYVGQGRGSLFLAGNPFLDAPLFFGLVMFVGTEG